MSLDTDEQLYVDLFFNTFNPERVFLLDVGSAVGRFTQGFIETAGQHEAYVSAQQFDPRYGGPAVGETVGVAEFSYLADEEHSHVTRPPGYQEALNAFCDNLGIPHVTFTLNKTASVEITTIDAVLKDKPFIPVFLKIDTEGHELAVLRGAKESIDSRKVYGIQFEYGGTWINQATLQEAADLLKEYDFWQYADGSISPLTDFTDDYWRSGNFLALLKGKADNES